MMHAARRSKLVLLAAVLAAVPACHAPSGTPRAAAEGFLDAHYVRIDLEAARPFCVGLALDKLEKEIALLKDNAEAAAIERPRVTYSLEQGKDGEASAQYAYDLVVHPGGVDPFHKLIVVSLRSENGEWRVSNYSESDR